MSTAAIDISQYLYDLESRGAAFAEDAGELQATAPDGVLDAEAIGFLKDHRGRVLALLRERAMSVSDPAARRDEVHARYTEARAKADEARPGGYHWDAAELGSAGDPRYDRAVQAEAAFEDACADYIESGQDGGRMSSTWTAYLASIKA